MAAMRVIFTEVYRYTPSANRRKGFKFKPSKKPQLVNEECGERALAAGVAILVEKPARARRARSA